MGKTDYRRRYVIRANQRRHGRKKVVDMKRKLLSTAKDWNERRVREFLQCERHTSRFPAVHQAQTNHHLMRLQDGSFHR